MKDLCKKLSLTQHQLERLINELSGHNELYWLNQMWRFPLSVETCRNLPIYNLLSKIVHVLKPNFSHGLQIWLTLYFTVIFSDGFESNDFSAWTGVYSSARATGTVINTQHHHGLYSAEFANVENFGYYQPYKRFGSTYTTLYMRDYIRLPTLPASGVHIEIEPTLCDSGFGKNMCTLQLWNNGGTMTWELSYYTNGGQLTATSTTEPPSANTWTYVEIYCTVGNGTGAVGFYVETSGKIIDIAGLTNNNGSLQEAVVGIYCPTAGYVVEHDCVVVADAYIGPEAAAAAKAKLILLGHKPHTLWTTHPRIRWR